MLVKAKILKYYKCMTIAKKIMKKIYKCFATLSKPHASWLSNAQIKHTK